MSLTDSCSYLNSLRESVKDLVPDQTKCFFTNMDGPYDEDEDLYESFQNFTHSIQTLHSWVDENDTLHIAMQRIFSPNETLSGKVSNTMKPFVWALGCKTIRCCLPTDFMPDMIVKSKTDGIFLLQNALQNTPPPVRSLQSLAFDAVQRHCICNEYTLNLFQDNPTFSKREGLVFVKDCTTMTMHDEAMFEDDFQTELLPITYPGPSDDDINSYHFTCCLATLHDFAELYRSSVSYTIPDGILIELLKLRLYSVELNKILLTCFQKIGMNSSQIAGSIFTSFRFIGFVLHSPMDCDYNKELLADIILKLLSIDKTPNTRVCQCRGCQEHDAGYQACLYFVERTVMKFQNAYEIF